MSDIESKIGKFLEILIHYCPIAGRKELKIDPEILAGCGFNIENNGDFLNIICPRLKRDGILKEYSDLRNPDDIIRDYQNPEKNRYPFTFIVDDKKLKEKLEKDTKKIKETFTQRDDAKKDEQNLKHNKKSKKYWINYTTNRVVVLNDKYIINKMQFNRYSDVWFQYLFENPNKNISLEEIRKETKENGDDFIRFLNNIKFKWQLRELFFTQSKTGIIFHNPITEEDFAKKLIHIKSLNEEIKKLRHIK